ncbi:MAG: 16S rRNA (guanine(527)-N(7))-methyltransferase RsmG [Bacteroidota bacterium]
MERLLHYFPNLTEKQIAQFRMLGELYADWNSKINVISRKDIENLYQNHVIHSLAISKVIQFSPGTNILDVGTGGGFPGIPLAIMFPQAKFHLVDSIGKKIRVVEEVATAIGLKNTTWQHARAEDVDDMYDFVVSRAVTRLPEFFDWVQNKFSPIKCNSLNNGILYLKGGDLTEELSSIKKPIRQYLISNWFDEEFYLEKKVVFVDCSKKRK